MFYLYSLRDKTWSLEDAPAPILKEGDYVLYQWGSFKTANLREQRQCLEWIKSGNLDFTLELNGRFQFLFLDLKTGDFKFYNNRYESGRFFYYQDHDEFILSDSAAQIMSHLRSNKKLQVHMPSVHNFLANGFNVSDECLIKNMKKIFPAQWLQKEESSFSVLSQWSQEFRIRRQEEPDLESHLDLYEITYRQSLADYLEQRQPEELGTLMSGGHDTSFVMIQAAQVFKKPIHGFTVVFPEWSFNERSFAKNICEKFGGIFHPVEFAPEHLNLAVSLIRANHEPVVGSSLPLHLLARRASSFTKTMLGGDGGDSLWGEYYPVAEYHRVVKSLPLFLRKALHGLSRLGRDVTDWERLWELEHVSALFAVAEPYSNFMRRLCTYRHFNDEIQKDLFAKDSISYSRGAQEVLFTKNNFSEALIEGKIYNAFLTYQAFHTTNCMNAFAMDFYMPTMDKQVVQFINSLPTSWLNAGNAIQRLSNSKSINRWFHKKALARYLSKDEIYNQCFDVPWFLLLRPRTRLLEILEKRLLRRGWYNPEFLQKMFHEFKQQKHKPYESLELKNHGYRIFTLLSLEIWCIEYLDGRMTDLNQALDLNLEEYLNVGI